MTDASGLRTVHRNLRVGCAILCVLSGAWLANLALFHWWAAGLYGGPYGRWHAQWGDVFGICAVGTLTLAGFIVWLLRPSRPAGVPHVGAESAFAVLITVLVMGLAIWSVPGTARVVLLTPVVLGGLCAIVAIRRRDRRD